MRVYGPYLGVAASAVSFAGIWSRRHRAVVLAFLSYGIVCYLLSLHSIAARLAGPMRAIPLSDFYEHAPGRFAVGAVELGLNALLGQTASSGSGRTEAHVPLRRPTIDGAAYLRMVPIERFLRTVPGSRYVTLTGNGLEVRERSRLTRSSSDWNAAADQRSMLTLLEDADAYNPTQPLRFWAFLRAVLRHRPNYNASYFLRPSALGFDLLDVGWEVAPTDRPPFRMSPRVTAGQWSLFGVPHPAPRASVFTSWRSVSNPEADLSAVSGPSFDPEHTLVVEHGLGNPRVEGRGRRRTSPPVPSPP
jgi:hypothetical protein